RQGSPRDQSVPVRHRLQRLRARLGRDSQLSYRGHVEVVRDRGLRRRDGDRAIRRHVPRVPVWGPAARGDGGRRGPHLDAARSGAEPARGGAFPDEPARRGSAHGRAVAADAEAITRTPYPRRRAGEMRRGARLARSRPAVISDPVLSDSRELLRRFRVTCRGRRRWGAYLYYTK